MNAFEKLSLAERIAEETFGGRWHASIATCRWHGGWVAEATRTLPPPKHWISIANATLFVMNSESAEEACTRLLRLVFEDARGVLFEVERDAAKHSDQARRAAEMRREYEGLVTGG